MDERVSRRNDGTTKRKRMEDRLDTYLKVKDDPKLAMIFKRELEELLPAFEEPDTGDKDAHENVANVVDAVNEDCSFVVRRYLAWGVLLLVLTVLTHIWPINLIQYFVEGAAVGACFFIVFNARHEREFSLTLLGWLSTALQTIDQFKLLLSRFILMVEFIESKNQLDEFEKYRDNQTQIESDTTQDNSSDDPKQKS